MNHHFNLSKQKAEKVFMDLLREVLDEDYRWEKFLTEKAVKKFMGWKVKQWFYIPDYHLN